MTDPQYNRDFFEGGIVVKQEPFVVDGNSLATSASMPIPARRALDMTDGRDFGIELDASNSPLMQDGLNSGLQSASQELYPSVNEMWGNRLCSMDSETIKQDSFKMDDDDIFQVDKADLIQGPTLAELNANDDTLLEDLNFDDLLLPEEKSYYINISPNPNQLQLKFINPQQITNNNTNLTNNNIFATSCPQNIFGFYKDSMESTSSIPSSPYANMQAFSPASQNSSTSSILRNSTASPPSVSSTPLQQKHSTLHELLLKKEVYSASPERQVLGQSVPAPTSPMASTSGMRSLFYLGQRIWSYLLCEYLAQAKVL